MLKDLVNRKMEFEHLSLRSASNQIGVSHTTIARVLKGDTVDMPTIIATCKWLGLTPADVLGSGTRKETLATRLAIIIDKEPRLAKVFNDAIDLMDIGELDDGIINDIIAYATFRMKVGRKD